MKTTLTLSILLLAGSANAQYRPIVPSFPGANNPIISLPKSMPSPLSGPLAGTLIQLPTPTVAPSLSLSAVSLPVAAIPAAPITARRENVANPMNRVLPTITVRFGETAQRQDQPKDSIQQDKQKDDLDHLFDGEAFPTHRPGRRINIPEREMEQELGL